MSKFPDGRRHNRPPEHGKILPGEVRNPFGRRGRPRDPAPNSIDFIYLKEAARVVSRDEDGPVSAARRLVQEEFLDALLKGDQTARSRVLEQLSHSSDRVEQQRDEIHSWVVARKAQLEDEFHLARKCGRPPPDVLPHPFHVRIGGDRIVILGPESRAAREAWEMLKALITATACIHDLARREYRQNPSQDVLKYLKAVEAERRQLMRMVPAGWNWREEIWCLDSRLEATREIVNDIRRMGYVDPSVED